MMIEKFIYQTRLLLESRKKKRSLKQLEKKLPGPAVRSMIDSLKKKSFALIAEVKKASPSAGVICKLYQPEILASLYEEQGARGISVLTCPYLFRGSLQHLMKVRSAVQLPVLRKDFLLDNYQILESRVYGADTVLLIARILSPQKLKEFSQLAIELGMEVLVEVHKEEELASVLKLDLWDKCLLGINNRDLDTLKIDLQVSFNLIKKIPCDRISVISASGVTDQTQLVRLAEAGFKGALVGTSILKAEDTGRYLRQLVKSVDGKNYCLTQERE